MLQMLWNEEQVDECFAVGVIQVIGYVYCGKSLLQCCALIEASLQEGFYGGYGCIAQEVASDRALGDEALSDVQVYGYITAG